MMQRKDLSTLLVSLILHKMTLMQWCKLSNTVQLVQQWLQAATFSNFIPQESWLIQRAELASIMLYSLLDTETIQMEHLIGLSKILGAQTGESMVTSEFCVTWQPAAQEFAVSIHMWLCLLSHQLWLFLCLQVQAISMRFGHLNLQNQWHCLLKQLAQLALL